MGGARTEAIITAPKSRRGVIIMVDREVKGGGGRDVLVSIKVEDAALVDGDGVRFGGTRGDGVRFKVIAGKDLAEGLQGKEASGWQEERGEWAAREGGKGWCSN